MLINPRCLRIVPHSHGGSPHQGTCSGGGIGRLIHSCNFSSMRGFQWLRDSSSSPLNMRAKSKARSTCATQRAICISD